MLRTLVLALFATACLDESPPRLDGFSSDPALSVDSYVGFVTCDGMPCTSIELDVRRDSLMVDAQVMASGDGQPAVPVPFASSGIHQFAGTIPQWIHHIRIDVTDGGNTAALWADAVVTTPLQAAPSIPAEVVRGSKAALRWNAQGAPVSATILFTRSTAPQAFGFLQTLGSDSGDFALEAPTFDPPGHYDVALHREVTHDYAGDARLYLTWSSSWQQQFDVIEPPPI
jgi:hypothetical protein